MWLDCQPSTSRAGFHQNCLIESLCYKLFASWRSAWSEGWFFTPPWGSSSFPRPTPREEWIEDGQFEANPWRGEYSTFHSRVYYTVYCSTNLLSPYTMQATWYIPSSTEMLDQLKPGSVISVFQAVKCVMFCIVYYTYLLCAVLALSLVSICLINSPPLPSAIISPRVQHSFCHHHRLLIKIILVQ